MSTPASADARELLVLCLGAARFGVWVDEALEIVRTPPISRLPLGSDEVPGVTSVRGDVIPVLDLGVRLMGEPAERPGRLVIIRHEESGSLVGLLVDAVESVIEVGGDQVIEPPSATESALPPDLVTGVLAGDEVVTILHLGRAAAPPQRNASGSRK